MAIEPFRQKIGVPDGAGITSQGVGQVADLGGSIVDVGQRVLAASEPFAKKKALDAAAEFVAATPIGKDAAGNYVMPETPQGGTVFMAAFEQAQDQQYARMVVNDTELKLNQIYSDPANIGMTPLEKREKATATIEGTLTAADPRVRGDLYEVLTRELRQRDLAESNLYLRKQTELIVGDNKRIIEEEGKKAIDAYSLGTGEALLAAGEHEQKLLAAADNQVALGFMSQAERDALPEKFYSYRGAGWFKQRWSKALTEGDLLAENNDLIADALEANVPEGTTVLGMSVDDLFLRIPDASVRARLADDIRSRSDTMRRQEAEEARSAEVEALDEDIPVGMGFPLRMSEDDKNKAAVQFAQANGIDPMSANGIVAIHQRFGALPTGLYKDIFSGAGGKSAAEIERLSQMYRVLQTMPDKNGRTFDASAGVMDARDQAFLYHYSEAREFGGLDPTQAMERARGSVAAGLSMDKGAVVSFLRERTGLTRSAGNDALGNRLDDATGVNWAAMNREAREAVELDVAQQVAMNVPLDVAVKSAGERFKANWTTDRYSAAAGLAGGKRAYIPARDAVPGILNVSNPKAGRTYQGWAEHYVGKALKEWMGEQPVPGLPAASELKLGKNVWLQATGLTPKGGGKLYNVIYFDPARPTGPVVLYGKDRTALTLDLGKAAQVQAGFAANFLRDKAASQRQGDALRAAAVRGSDPRSFIRGVVASSAMGRDLDLKPDISTAFGRWQVQHKAKYGGHMIAPVRLEDAAPPKYAVAPSGAAPGTGKITRDTKPLWQATAQRLGISPVALLGIAYKESSLRANAVGGDNDAYEGLFQFSPENRKKYGINKNSSVEAQLAALERYARDRGYRPGMGWRALYTTINAGNPHVSTKARDSNGSQEDHYAAIQSEGFRRARAWLSGA